jgi:hypothetical protein
LLRERLLGSAWLAYPANYEGWCKDDTPLPP